MPYDQKRVKDGSQPGRTDAHDPFFTGPEQQAAAPAPFFTRKDADKEDAPVQFMQPKAAAAGRSDAKTTVASPPKANDTGLPDDLKAGMEDLSGFSLDDVNVHYNSDRPVQLQAHAYTQGRDIHVGPGQEKHLPHEAWHVVQQKQGRVSGTMQMKGFNINDDEGLEKEADVMGRQAKQRGAFADGGEEGERKDVSLASAGAPVQRLTGFEVETNIPVYHNTGEGSELVNPKYREGFTAEIRNFLFGGLKYGLSYGFDPEGHFSLTADHNELQTPHNKLMHLLSLSGFLKPEIRNRNMANLEYVTSPRDELGTGSRELFHEDVEHVKAHVNKTLGMAKSGRSLEVPDTGNWMLTGVPVKDILTWVRLHKAPSEAFEMVLNEMDKLITNKLYVQETTGVLPEDIPALYESGSKRMKGDKLTTTTVMADFMEAAVQLGLQAYDLSGPEKSSKLFGTQKLAVVGFLTYLASHLLADSLSLTNFKGSNSTDKNLFPYFPKVQLSTAYKALPQELRNEKNTWKALVEALCKIASAHCLKYWTSKGLTIDKDLLESKIFKEVNPYFATSQEEERDVKPDIPQARTTLNMLVEGEEVAINVQKNFPDLDKPRDEVVKATGGQQAIPVEDRYWNNKFGKDITTDTIGDAFMLEVNAAIERQSGHLSGSEKEQIQKGVDDKPDHKGMQQQRLEAKLKGIQDFPASMKEKSDYNRNLVEISKAKAEQFGKAAAEREALIAKVETPMAQLEEINGSKRLILLDAKRLKEEKESLEGKSGEEKAKSDESTAAALKKIQDEQDALKPRLLLLQQQERPLLGSVSKDLGMPESTFTAVKQKVGEIKRQLANAIKMAQQHKDDMARAIEDEKEYQRISDRSLKFAPTGKLPEVNSYEEGKPVEKDLNERSLEQKKLENTWLNRLNDKDTLYSFTKAKAGLEKDLKIDLAKRKKKIINIDLLKDPGAKAAIKQILEEAAAPEAVIIKYDSLTVTDASPQAGTLLFEYMKVAGQYTGMMGKAYDIYVKAEKQDDSTEKKDEGMD